MQSRPASGHPRPQPRSARTRAAVGRFLRFLGAGHRTCKGRVSPRPALRTWQGQHRGDGGLRAALCSALGWGPGRKSSQCRAGLGTSVRVAKGTSRHLTARRLQGGRWEALPRMEPDGRPLPPLQVTEGDIGPFSAVKVPVIFSPVTPGAIQTRFKVTFDNQECPTVSVPQTLDTHGHCRVDPSWTQGPGLPAPPHRTRGSCPRHPRSRC